MINAAGELKYIGRLENALGGPDAYVSVSNGAIEVEPPRRRARNPLTSIATSSPAKKRTEEENNRKPIARLWLNRSKKYLGVFDENKVESA